MGLLSSSLISAPEEDWAAMYSALESRRKSEIEALLRIGLATAAPADLADLLRRVHQSLSGALDLTLFVVGMADEAAGQLSFPLWLEAGLSRSVPPTDLYRNHWLAGLAVRLRQPLTSADRQRSFSPVGLAPGVPLPAAYIALPLLSQGRAMGALVVGSAQSGAYGKDELRLLKLVAIIVSLAVEKARLYEAVSRHARSLEERVVARTAELEREKTRFESTVQSLGEGLILFDLGQTISFANNRALSLLGLPLETVLGLAARSLLAHPALSLDVPEKANQQFGRRLETVEAYPTLTVSCSRGGPRDGPRLPEGRLAENAGAVLDLNLRLFPVRDQSGKLLGGGLILRDITLEQEMDRMKDELVNVVSHELRTPMASILGFAELLLTRDFPEDRRRQLIETIHKEAERLSALINDFLDLRRMESGRQQLTFTEVCLAEVVQSVAASFALSQQKHTLQLDLPDSLAPVRADPERLRQALHNLLANAFKYSPRGGRVTVAARETGDEVRFTVTDEGLGLPAGVIPQLFQRFYRVDCSDRREIGGTGLGLAIVKEIISAHGGRVWAESPGPGRGSTFGFTLPLAIRSNHAPPTVRPVAPAAPYVLVVEDDPVAADLIREHLEATGYQVAVATQPVTALDLIQQRAPLGIVLDLCLPEAEQGRMLLEEIRRTHPAARLPIIVTSALDERAGVLSRGATAFLVKPFDPRRLVALLRRRPGCEVLVVDDEPMILHLMRSLLERCGYRVQGVSSGSAALASLKTSPPDLMILDLMMPKMDGFEVLEQVRALPAGRELPVVVVTARTLSRTDYERLQRHGAFLLTKGEYTAVRLRAAVERALREKWSLRSALCLTQS